MESLQQKIEKAEAIVKNHQDELEPDLHLKRKLEVEHIEFNKHLMNYKVKKFNISNNIKEKIGFDLQD